MIKVLRLRFWLETVMATITGILFIITIVWPHWVEMIFHVSLDNGNGSFERLIVGSCLVITLVLSVLGRYEWRRARSVYRDRVHDSSLV